MAGEEFRNRNHAGLEAIVEAFLAGRGHALAAACFGVAGPVADGRIHMPNLDWLIDAHQLRKTLGVNLVVLLNNLEATAYGIKTLAPDRFAVVNQGAARGGANAR